MRQDLYTMFKWAINKAFESHPETMISRNELVKIVERVWNDMVDDGYVVLEGETKENDRV